MQDEPMMPEELLFRLLAGKQRRRTELARLPYEEKVAIVLRMQQIARQVRAAAAARRAGQETP